MSLRVVALAALAILIVIFAVQNVTPVEIRFFNFGYELPLAIVITGAAVLGGLLIGLLSLIRQVGLKSKMRGQMARADQSEAQLKEALGRQQVLTDEGAALRAKLATAETELTQLRSLVPPGAVVRPAEGLAADGMPTGEPKPS